MEQTEEWRPARYLKKSGELINIEGAEVSNFGRVRRIKDGFEYKQSEYPEGYLYIIHKGFVHRIVLSSFTDNTDGSLQVNHKDENKHNNRLENLEWMTPKENNNYGTRNERVRASNKGKSKSDEHRQNIRESRIGKPSGTTGKHWRLNSDGKRVYF